MSIMTGLSGNEMYCLHLKGLSPGELVVGNSVYSLGFVGGVTAFLKSFSRGEVSELTSLIYEARENCLDHIRREGETLQVDGIIGVKVFIYELGGGMVEVAEQQRFGRRMGHGGQGGGGEQGGQQVSAS